MKTNHPSRWRAALAAAVGGCGMLFAMACPAGQPFTQRLTAIHYDFDNNGIVDATTTLTYDTAGRVTDTAYVYSGDGATDLFVTEGADAAREDSTFTYSADDLLTEVAIVRQLAGGGSVSSQVLYTFAGGLLTRVDTQSTSPATTSATYTTLSYTGTQLAALTEHLVAGDTPLLGQSYQYGSNGLPSTVTLQFASGAASETSLSWRSDGRIAGLESTANFGGDDDVGSAAFLYDDSGLLQSETWTFSGAVGSIYSEYLGRRYRTDYSYDSHQLRVRENLDIGSDGSVEAVVTFEWEEDSCVPVYFFAYNGQPNFVRMDGLPYVPGTGATYVENCGPFIAAVDEMPAAEDKAVPAMAPAIQLAGLALVALIGAWCFRRRVA